LKKNVRHAILQLDVKEVFMRSEKAIVSSKGQVVIPRSMRKALGIHAGTELIFSLQGKMLEATPVKRNITMFFGCCKKELGRTMKTGEMDETIQKVVLEEDAKSKKN
jgi:AbrB family looped-hinge helix DNA binding protein